MMTADAAQRGVACSGCGGALPVNLYNDPELAGCPNCQSMVEVRVFPALYQSLKAVPAESELAAGEANCFNHPQKKAVVVCEDCGRFLCALCEVEIGGKRSCPDCIERGRTQGEKQELITRRTMHDSIALSMALLPALMWPVTFLTAPAALFYAIRHWKSPTSILPRTKIRYLSAMLFAVLQIGGWLALVYGVMTS